MTHHQLLQTRLNPESHLPAVDSTPLPDTVHDFATELLRGEAMRAEWSGRDPAGVAACALYLGLVVREADLVRQRGNGVGQAMIAEIVGSSSIAIRTHQEILAEVALQKGLSRTTKERETLQQLAGVSYLDVL